ncbi:MAG: hypothetical protein RLY14_2869 [Planctomycetota bacterium]|jgi:hypothetical protein
MNARFTATCKTNTFRASPHREGEITIGMAAAERAWVQNPEHSVRLTASQLLSKRSFDIFRRRGALSLLAVSPSCSVHGFYK